MPSLSSSPFRREFLEECTHANALFASTADAFRQLTGTGAVKQCKQPSDRVKECAVLVVSLFLYLSTVFHLFHFPPLISYVVFITIFSLFHQSIIHQIFTSSTTPFIIVIALSTFSTYLHLKFTTFNSLPFNFFDSPATRSIYHLNIYFHSTSFSSSHLKPPHNASMLVM